MARTKRSFGGLRQLPSKRWQANYTGPDGLLHKAPHTFLTKMDAEAWLTDEHRLISRSEWTPPARRNEQRLTTFATYFDVWLTRRTLKPRTRSHYRSLNKKHLEPTFGELPLRGITSTDVGEWYVSFGDSRPTLRSHAYGLLRTVLASAMQDQLIAHNPCHIRGAGNAKRVTKTKPASLDELATLVEATEPAKYRAMILLAAWCALRFGELAELRRKDVHLSNQVIHVRRAVVRVDGQTVVGTPKSDAGTRDVAIPPHLVPMLREHINDHAQWGKDGLLFPAANGEHLAPSTLYRSYYAARDAAGRPDLRFHDLRHTGAVLAAQTGATLAELMGRLGHSTPGAAMRYQHAAQNRDQAIAAALSSMVERQQ